MLYCGLLAGPLFTLVFLLDGWTRGAGYDVRRHPVSSLALGDRRWLQTANFLVAGVLTIVFAIGIWQADGGRVGAVLVGGWGLGLLGAGAFVTDPVSGYPVGTPDTLSRYTRSGALHDGISMLGFLALAAAQIVLAFGHGPVWLGYSVLSAVAFVGCLALASAGFGQHPRWIGVAGLLQRAAVGVGLAWTVVLAVRLIGGS